MLPLPLLLLLLVAVATLSALCVSGSVLFLALFLPYPIQQSVDQVTVLCVLFIYPNYTTTLLNPSLISSNPTQGHALRQRVCCQGQHAPALHGNGCYCCQSGTNGVKVQERQVINKYRDICFSEEPAVQPIHCISLTLFSQCRWIQNLKSPDLERTISTLFYVYTVIHIKNLKKFINQGCNYWLFSLSI